MLTFSSLNCLLPSRFTATVVLSMTIICTTAFTFTVRTNKYSRAVGYVAVGNIVSTSRQPSALQCCVACTSATNCTAANYKPAAPGGSSVGDCSLVNVEDALDDWLEEPRTNYYCLECLQFNGPQVAVGFWKMDNPIENMRDKTNIIESPGITFVPGVPGGSSLVASFAGTASSYIKLLNTGGELVVSSFTWMAHVFHEGTESAPLFNWVAPPQDTDSGGYGTHIWILSNQLFLRVVRYKQNTYPSHQGNTADVFVQNAWNVAAVSLDTTTGIIQLSLNGVVTEINISYFGPHSTSGPVFIGYPHKSPADTRYFKGKMACMRLWGVWRNLTMLRETSPLCDYQ